MGLTQRQSSFSNYEAIKRMKAARPLDTFPEWLGLGINYSTGKFSVPWELLCSALWKFQGWMHFLAARKFVKQECENWNCQDWNKKQTHFIILRRHQGWGLQLLSWMRENRRPWLEKMECNYVMMSWEKVAKKNCNAEHDGCCSVRRNCWNAQDGKAA